MADTIKSANELRLVAKFRDNDTRTLTLENPKSGLTEAQINAVAAVGKTTQALLGDRNSADFIGFAEARTFKKTVTYLDLK